MFSRLRLGTQLWLVISFLLAAASAGLAWYLSQVQTRSLTAATQQRLSMKEDSLTAKAALLARNAALASASAAVTLDFDFLQGVMSKTVQGDDSIRFGYIVDASDKVVVHSDPKLVGTTIKGAGQPAKDTKNGVSVTLQPNDILEAVAPIMVGQDVWGAVHYGVSYEPVRRDAKVAREQLAAILHKSLVFTVVLAFGLVLLCVLVSILAASRLVRPLRALESAVQQVLARGASLRVQVPRLKELARLASGFNVLLARLDEWEQRLRGQRLRADLVAFAAERQMSDAHRAKLREDWETYLDAAAQGKPTAVAPTGGSLRARLIGLTMVLTTSSVLITGGLLFERTRHELNDALSSMSGQVRLDLADKGFSITRNAALAVSQAASVREYLFLMQIVRSTILADSEIVTGFIQDPKGRVLVHSDPNKAGSVDSVSEHEEAMRLNRPESRFVDDGKTRVLEVTAPIQVGTAAWGTLSFGLSDAHQKEVFAELEAAQQKRVDEALRATAMGIGALVVLALITAWLAARRIVGPLDKLTRDLDAICGGARKLRVEVYTCRELTTFSMSINELTAMTYERELELQRQLKQAQPLSA